MKNSVVILFVFLAVTTVSAGRYALLVGNNRGGSYQPLKYVRNDIQGMEKVLTQFCRFEKQHVITLINQPARKLGSVLDSLQKRFSADDEMFLFYYSGHADHENLLMGTTRYSLAILKKHLKIISTQMRVLMFDACQSGSFARLKGGTLQAPFLYKDENKIEGQVVIYSSSENEFSQESDRYNNSVFTFHFINALRGCADVSGDKKVTLTEAYNYSYDRTVSSTVHSTGGIQHPGYQFKIQGEGSVVLSDITTKTSGIILGRNIAGSLIVLGAGNTLTADLSKEKGTMLFIALNPGTYEIINSRGSAAYKTRVSVKKDHIITVTNDQFRKSRVMPVYSKGSKRQAVTFGIMVLGGFADFNLASLSSQCNSHFSGYQMFSMQPEFSFPAGDITGGLGLEANFRNGLQACIYFDYFRLHDKQEYNGITTSPNDTNSYPAALSIFDTLLAVTIHTGIGYTFQHRLFQFISLRAGVDIIVADYSIESKFVDELYHMETRQTFSDRGLLVLPSIGGTFRYSFPSPFSIGAIINYRYQNGSKSLYSQKEKESVLRYNFSGINVSLFFSYIINRR